MERTGRVMSGAWLREDGAGDAERRGPAVVCRGHELSGSRYDDDETYSPGCP